METLLIEPTKSTPKINFDPENSFFEIKGLSKPEDVRSFFYPVLEWLDELELALDKKSIHLSSINLNLKLYYFNSSSAKFLVDIISKFDEMDIPININWYYEEGDMDLLDAGRDMSEMVDIRFNYIPVKQMG